MPLRWSVPLITSTRSSAAAGAATRSNTQRARLIVVRSPRCGRARHRAGAFAPARDAELPPASLVPLATEDLLELERRRLLELVVAARGRRLVGPPPPE